MAIYKTIGIIKIPGYILSIYIIIYKIIFYLNLFVITGNILVCL